MCGFRFAHPGTLTFTEEEMDTFLEKGDTELFLEEIHRRQKASRRVRKTMRKTTIPL